VTNETGVTWYDAATAGNVVIPTTALVNGRTYYGSLKVGTCESPTRLAVMVTISDPKTPTGTAAQEFCKNSNATVASLVTNETGVNWYDAATLGNVVSLTTALVNGTTYYGSLKVGTCESPTRLAVTVTISDPQTPTTANSSQEFCKSSNATIASLATNETGVIWYDAATAGNVVSSTTALVNGRTYYGSLKVGTCESPKRLAVTVKISDPQTPTTANSTQEFLKSSSPTVASLVTNETGISWYDAPTGGNIVSLTTALENDKTYYGSLKAGTCESPTRLEVNVKLKDPKTPTTNDPTQEFLKSSNPTISNLVTNETGVIWYDAPTGGNVIDPKTALTDGKTYYGAIKDGSIESPTRLEVKVILKDSLDIGLEMTVDNPTPDIGQQVVFTITVENRGAIDVKDIIISNKLPSGYDYVTSQVSSGNYGVIDGVWTLPIVRTQESYTLLVTAIVKGSGDYLNVAYLKSSDPEDSNATNVKAEASIQIKEVVVYNALSLGGDGTNDYLRIDGLQQYPNNTLEIFNSTGIPVFKTSNYGNNNNVFRGISEGKYTISKGSGLPTGTYFYILRYETNGIMKEKTGYLYIKNN
ncbi:gliding motility-associated C-terminal domain-containing protein, partial [Flavobacterium sp. WG21]|uniref:Ig-like domain-containing protein n=1 Tax=Flavobacterium sp. WG21 TaxID=1229487 RepID=UPI0003620988